MMHLFLEPLDVWLFRDGRPFDAGSDHRAQSVFPPYPSVMQGVIRSHHLVVQGVDLRDQHAIRQAVGMADDLLGLRLRGPFVARREQQPDGSERIVRYLPQPADAAPVKGQTALLRRASPPDPPDESLITSAPTPELLGLRDEPAKGTVGRWLREDELRRYLAGEPAAAEPEAELFMRESRFGIGVDNATRTTREGALYEAEFIRPCPGIGLLVELDGYDGWSRQGLLRLGGEARAAMFERVEATPWPSPSGQPSERTQAGIEASAPFIYEWPSPPDPLPERFSVYFATPALFDGGWQPAGGDWKRFFTGEVRIVAAAVGRYESVGGFDLAGNRHKPARRHVPAGSVYYFAARGGARLRPELTGQAMTDHGGAMGFGQILIGEVARV